MSAIKFMKHYVTNGELKARVHYSDATLISGEVCVTLYAKDFKSGHALGQMFDDEYENNTDMMTDYFEKGRVRIPQNSPLYAAAKARCA